MPYSPIQYKIPLWYITQTWSNRISPNVQSSSVHTSRRGSHMLLNENWKRYVTQSRRFVNTCNLNLLHLQMARVILLESRCGLCLRLTVWFTFNLLVLNIAEKGSLKPAEKLLGFQEIHEGPYFTSPSINAIFHQKLFPQVHSVQYIIHLLLTSIFCSELG